jgi:hypothetical protein
MASTISIRLEGDGLRFEIDDGKHRVSAMATTGEVENLISTLANLRAKLSPPVPRTVPDTPISGLFDPIVAFVKHAPSEERRPIMFRHDGYGWLSFLLTSKSAKSLAGYLNAGPAQTESPLPDRMN